MFLIGEYRPRLRLVLLVANLALLGLPVLGAVYLRLYETELVQRTETLLATQGAIVGVIYRSTLSAIPARQTEELLQRYTPVLIDSEGPRHEVFGTRSPTLNLRTDPIRPQLFWKDRSDVHEKSAIADPLAASIGELLEPYLVEMKSASQAEIQIIDVNGFVVASTTGQPYPLISIHGGNNLSSVFEGKDTRSLHRNDAVEQNPLMRVLTHGGTVSVVVGFPIIMFDRVIAAAVLSKTPDTMFDSFIPNRDWMIPAGFLIFVAVVLYTLLIAFMITRPVRAVIDQIKRAILGERGVVRPIRRTVTREVKELSQAISTMAMEL